MQLSCQVVGNAVKLHLGPHEGGFHPWWNQVRIEVYGWNSNTSSVIANGQLDPQAELTDPQHHMVTVTVPDDGHGVDLEIRPRP